MMSAKNSAKKAEMAYKEKQLGQLRGLYT